MLRSIRPKHAREQVSPFTVSVRRHLDVRHVARVQPGDQRVRSLSPWIPQRAWTLHEQTAAWTKLDTARRPIGAAAESRRGSGGAWRWRSI
jgi:hypothetical protein